MKKYRFLHRIASIFLCFFILSSSLLFTLHSNWYYKCSKQYFDNHLHTKTISTTTAAVNYETLLLQIVNPRSHALRLPSYEINDYDFQNFQMLRWLLIGLNILCFVSLIIVILCLTQLQNLQQFGCFIQAPILAFILTPILFAGITILSTHNMHTPIDLLQHQERSLLNHSEILKDLLFPGYTVSHLLLFLCYLVIFFILGIFIYRFLNRKKTLF